jgi:hypothetical protein
MSGLASHDHQHAGYPARCLYPEPPSGLAPNCQEAGGWRACRHHGILQASEAIGKVWETTPVLVIYDALDMKFRRSAARMIRPPLSADPIRKSKISIWIMQSAAPFNIVDLIILPGHLDD